MDTYGEFGLGLLDWMANRSGALLVLLATLPLTLLLKQGRLLGYSALAVFGGAVTLILLGVESLAGAFIVNLANTLLLSIALHSTRKRLTQMEVSLASVVATVGELETAEERRQTYSAKRSSTSRVHQRRKPDAGTVEQIGATASLAREAPMVPGPPWQELQVLDLRQDSAVLNAVRPASRNPASRKNLRRS
ncbi:hypothetical protein [Mesorhizobium atlanticum]|jgi:hypothetical protein|uniref:Uncharacterized protein n=1 Tax=Mesorhizobium atlanticum TaxID=2233532 RepID=A0A330H3G4_9HYPH|nr:hypothetical protein [Mesorhizobium atlanticum]RAZ80607.1 hypothetical protein DPM35_04880 [Mesorhizobium atlanticum]